MEDDRPSGCFISKETIERTYIEGRPSRGRRSPGAFLDREREKNFKMFLEVEVFVNVFSILLKVRV